MRPHYRAGWLFLNVIERALFGFRVTGRERIPRTGGVIIASNHVSYADPPVVGSAVPREVYFLAKEELFKNPAFGWLIRRYNAIALRRAVGDIGAVKKAVELLKDGRAVLMFPEGTRSLSGRLLKPKPGLGLIACLAGVAVVPAYVRGTSALGRAILRKPALTVSFGEPVEPGRFGAGAVGGVGGRAGTADGFESGESHDRYRQLVEEVMRRIEQLAQEARAEERGAQ